MNRPRKALLWFGAILLFLFGIGYGYYCYRFPYGYSHCCDKILSMELRRYAESHDGWFPQREKSPEASLSLLYREGQVDAYLLRGKIIPLETVQAILDQGELLTPDSCGWHFVEGLRMDDDHRIALFWDKVGLGHNGERRDDGGHTVGFVGGDIQSIPGNKWESFLEEQNQLLEEVKRKRKAK